MNGSEDLPQLQILFNNVALRPVSWGLWTKGDHLTGGLPVRSYEVTRPKS